MSKKASDQENTPTVKTDVKLQAEVKVSAQASDDALSSTANSRAAMPLFYVDPVPLSFERHGKLRLTTASNYRFAAQTNAVPLTITEFILALRHYPILFSQGVHPMPFALVGVELNKNLFVDKNGNWAADTYIPEYVQRYPFIFHIDADSDRWVLCVDEAGNRLSNQDGIRLFNNKQEPTQNIQDVLVFCGNYQKQHEASLEFSNALLERDLLIERNANITLANGQTMELYGFSLIDTDKFDRLSDETILEWRNKGWLALIYYHIASTTSWRSLIDRAAHHTAAQQPRLDQELGLNPGFGEN